ncbi:molecular chaperone [Stenotrophomonas sp.]|uniref:fimbrial biogenesis chaperone n=1 Tax=Stenotrophomonas sp. TaxID=69392 RepID=UPI0028ACFF57|nr:molecular chaperone [Stenotrophomonas sp.]
MLLLLACAGSSAASLQVAPTSLQLTPRQNAEALWISNSGTTPVDVQARVYRWTQRDGRDTLDPTIEVVVSPPMQTLAAGQQQLIRVVRADPTPPPAQLAYRVIVDEVPAMDPGRQGMQFVLRYSLPVFIQPEGDLAPRPDLQARVLPEADGRLVLEVHNRGTGHAQLADLAVGTPQQPQIVQPGLVGYVLSGQTMRWPLDITAARMVGATLSAKINGASDPTPLSPTPPAR